MAAGHTFTIEPMICEGSADYLLWDDEWTAVSIKSIYCINHPARYFSLGLTFDTRDFPWLNLRYLYFRTRQLKMEDDRLNSSIPSSLHPTALRH